MKKDFFDSDLWKWIVCFFEIALIAGIIYLFICIISDIQFVRAEEAWPEEYEEVWVICEPDSYVMIREKPKKNSNAFGGATLGSKLKTDGTEKNGYIHVLDLAAEESSGWISTQHIVYDEPVKTEQKALVVSNGRLAARSGVNGKIKSWMKPMTELTIRILSDEWCLTNYGYVQTVYIEMLGE